MEAWYEGPHHAVMEEAREQSPEVGSTGENMSEGNRGNGENMVRRLLNSAAH